MQNTSQMQNKCTHLRASAQHNIMAGRTRTGTAKRFFRNLLLKERFWRIICGLCSLRRRKWTKMGVVGSILPPPAGLASESSSSLASHSLGDGWSSSIRSAAPPGLAGGGRVPRAHAPWPGVPPSPSASAKAMADRLSPFGLSALVPKYGNVFSCLDSAGRSAMAL